MPSSGSGMETFGPGCGQRELPAGRDALEQGSASRLHLALGHKVRPRFQFIQFNTCETRYISF